MNRFCSIFSQVLQLFSRLEFESALRQHKAERHGRGFTWWGQFVAMLFCQLGRAQSLREICGGLAALARRETRLEKIREAKRALEERAREQAKSKGEPEAKAKPKAKMQYNFTDSESRIMKGADGFVQAYNAQLAVEPEFQLIVGQKVTQAANDKQQMKPLVELIQEQSGQKAAEVVSDSGYCSEANLKYLEKKKIEGFVAVFGQIKQARGFRQFLLRGLKKVQGEWAILCLMHNILKLHRICYG